MVVQLVGWVEGGWMRLQESEENSCPSASRGQVGCAVS
jgi:hypothetical protein